MSDLINCPICGIETKPDYCSDKCLWTSLERSRIIELLEDEGVLNGAALSDNWSRQIIARIKGENK